MWWRAFIGEPGTATGADQDCPGCKDALREFSLYQWDNSLRRDAPKKENDHAMDDIRYFVSTVLNGEEPGGVCALAVERK